MSASTDSSTTQNDKYDQYLNDRIGQTVQQVRWVELLSFFLMLSVFVLGSLFVLCLIDAWVFELNVWMRWIALSGMIVIGVGFSILRAFPFLIHRVNPLYAAKKLEEGRPELKNSVINYLTTKDSSGKGVDASIQTRLSRQAATDVANIPLDVTVDRSPMIIAGYTLAGIVAIFALYKVLSPKDPFQTIKRVVLPSAELMAPSRVKITDVNPGDDKKYFGESLQISARIKGLGDGEFARILITSESGLQNDQGFLMTREGESDVFRFTVGEEGGLRESFSYRIQAGDAVTVAYQVDVRTCPTVFLEKIQYQPPTYTQVPPSTESNPDRLSGLEGTKVVFQARTNLPIESAYLKLYRKEKSKTQTDVSVKAGEDSKARWKVAKSIKLEVKDEFLATGEMLLELNAKRTQPRFTHFQIVFTAEDGSKSENPTLSRIEVIPDLKPEIEVVSPTEKVVEVPQDQIEKIELSAVDPDYGLTSVVLVAEQKGTRLFEKQVFRSETKQGLRGKQLSSFSFRPDQFGLEAGDEVIWYARAEDNRAVGPESVLAPNRARTENYKFVVTAPLNRNGSRSPENNDAKDPENKDDPENKKDPENPPPEQNKDPNKKSGSKSEKNEKKGQSEKQNPSKDQKQDGKKGSGNQDQKQPDKGQPDKGQPEKGKSGGNSKDSKNSNPKKGESKSEPSKGQKNQPQNGKSAKSPDKSKKSQSPDKGKSQNSEDKKSGSQKTKPQKGSGDPDKSNQTENQKNDPSNSNNSQNEKSTAGKSSDNNDPTGDRPDPTTFENPNGDNRGSESSDSENENQGKPQNAKEAFERMKKYFDKKNRDKPENSKGSDPAKKKSQDQKENPSKSSGSQTDQSDKKKKQDDQPGKSDSSQNKKSPNGQTGEKKKQPEASKNGEETPGKKTPGKKTQGEKTPGKKTQGEKTQGEKTQGEKTQGEKTPGKKNPGEKSKEKSQNKNEPGKQNEKGTGDRKKGETPKNDSGSPSGKKKDGSKGNPGQKSPNEKSNDPSGKKQSGKKQPGKNQPESKKQNGSEKDGNKGSQKNKSDNKGAKSDSSKRDDGKSGKQKQKGDSSKNDDRQPQKDSGGNTGNVNQSDSKAGQETNRSNNQSSAGNDRPETQAEKANLNYTKEATDMVLEKLKDQKERPDEELLKDLKWTEDELREFTEKWEAMRDKAKSGSSKDKRRFDEALKSLGLKDPDLKSKNADLKNDDRAGYRQRSSTRDVPSDFARKFRAIQKSQRKLDKKN